MRSPLLATAALLLLLSGCGDDAPAVARSGPSFVTDDEGRALVLRGTNVDNHAKASEGHRIDISDDEINLLAKDLGLNFVRYLVFWDGVEPEPGVYDEAYLDRIEADLDRFHAAGMWVLVDFHQDVYSGIFCCDGAPEWAVRDNGIKFSEAPQWFLNYLHPAVKASFDNFWAYTDGEHADLQDHYTAMVRHVAERLREHPAVLGYDVMNEPHPGSDFDTLAAFNPNADSEKSRTFDETKLHSFYQRAIYAIREVDSTNWIFFEPRYGSPGNGGHSYIPPLIDPRRGESRLVLAPHLYSIRLESGGEYLEDDKTIELWEQRRKDDLARQGMPLVLGEWGLAFGATGADRYVTDLAEMSERMILSWAHWSWDPGGPTGWAIYDRDNKSVNPLFQHIERPYPRATAGEPVSLDYDQDAKVLTYVWNQTKVGGETEFYFPAARDEGSAAFVVELSDPAGSWSFEWDAALPGLLRVTADAGSAAHTLTIRPTP